MSYTLKPFGILRNTLYSDGRPIQFTQSRYIFPRFIPNPHMGDLHVLSLFQLWAIAPLKNAGLFCLMMFLCSWNLCNPMSIIPSNQATV
jgi:hypothetical protein